MSSVSKMVMALGENQHMSWTQKATLLAPELAQMCDAFMKGASGEGSQAFISKVKKFFSCS